MRNLMKRLARFRFGLRAGQTSCDDGSGKRLLSSIQWPVFNRDSLSAQARKRARLDSLRFKIKVAAVIYE